MTNEHILILIIQCFHFSNAIFDFFITQKLYDQKNELFFKIFDYTKFTFYNAIIFIGVIHFMEKGNNRPTIEKNKETDKK